jgi:hypothetical protein
MRATPFAVSVSPIFESQQTRGLSRYAAEIGIPQSEQTTRKGSLFERRLAILGNLIEPLPNPRLLSSKVDSIKVPRQHASTDRGLA